MMFIVKQVEFNFWVNIEGKIYFCGMIYCFFEDVMRISCRGGFVRIGDIVEYFGCVGVRMLWQNLEGGWIGVGYYICFVDVGIFFDS